MVAKTKKPATKPVRGKKKKKVSVTTPVGILSYPHLLEADSGRQYSDDKKKTDLLIPEAEWKTDPAAKKLREAVLICGRKLLKDPDATLSDFKNPFQRTNKLGEKYSDNERTKNCVVIRAKTEFDPWIVDAGKEELDDEAIKKIKGGDYARLVVNVYSYTQQGGGVTLGLQGVQYIKSGEALGGGYQAQIDELDEIEIEADDIDEPEETDDDETDEDEEEEKPKTKKKPAKKGKKPAVDEDEEDTDDDSEAEDADEDDGSEEDNDNSDEDDVSVDDDEEEEKPKAKKGKKPAGKPAKAVKGKKAKKADDEDEEEDEDSDDFTF